MTATEAARDAARTTPGECLDSIDPATGATLGHLPVASDDEVHLTVARARAAQAEWAEMGARHRGRVLLRAARLLHADIDGIARLISAEQGKPLLESVLHDVATAIEACFYCAAEVPRLLAPERVRSPQLAYRAKRHTLHYEPYGVVGVVSPWNFPMGIPMSEVVIALACGNAVVLKPSELTPLVGQRIVDVLRQAGVPRDVVVAVHGAGKTGAALIPAGVDKLFFTGSVATGRRVMRQAADALVPVVLELGGKDPMLVLDDADLDLAVRGAVWGAFANAGQVCASVERIYIDRRLEEEFTDRVAEVAASLRVGRFDEDGVDVGPMVSDRQRDIVADLVDDAVRSGARLLTGGPDSRGGRFYRPTVLADVRPDMRIMREEVFGPVLPIMAVGSEDEAVAHANDCDYGLSASVWTRSRRRGLAVARRLHAGSVWVNDHMYSHQTTQLPWGGVKQSGFGRAHGKHGVYECVQVKMVGEDSGRLPRPHYFPYGSRGARMVPGLVRGMYGRGVLGRVASALRRVPS